MTSAFSWQNSISLCPASFHIPRPNLPVTSGVSCRRRNDTPTLQSGLNLYILTLASYSCLIFISFLQPPTGQAAKHYDSETIQCAGAGQDNLYLGLFTAAKTLFGGTSLST